MSDEENVKGLRRHINLSTTNLRLTHVHDWSMLCKRALQAL